MSLPACQSLDDSLYGSWVELEGFPAVGASRRDSVTGPQGTVSSFLQGELESILQDAQMECERSSHTDSPPQDSSSPPQTTTEVNSRKECITQSDECQCGTKAKRRVSAEWPQNWSRRPKNLPSRELVFQQLKQSASLSMRKSVMMKSGIFTSDLLLFFIPSLLTSHLLTLGVGIYIGKRLAACTSTL